MFHLPDLTGRVAIVTGSSRGIGKAVALRLAEAGCDICVAAKSERSRPNLPGSIHETCEAVEALGRRALALRTDVRQEADLKQMVARTVETFGRLDILVNNAGALWWKDVTDTPASRFDMMMDINARAPFLACHYALPHMKAGGWGHIIMMSPPILPDQVAHKTAYFMSKYGMTLIAHGLAGEVAADNVACNALWPATLIESQATINFKLGEPAHWRKAAILADATAALCSFEPKTLTGQALLDEEVLRQVGVSDFDVYSCVPGSQPLRLDALKSDVTHEKGGNPFARAQR